MVISSKVFGANDTIGMGIIGPGRRGSQLMGDFNRLKHSWVAISDVNSKPWISGGGKDWKKCQDSANCSNERGRCRHRRHARHWQPSARSTPTWR
jgi:hypothetical protein